MSDLGALAEALRCFTIDTLMNHHRQRQTIFITNDNDKNIVYCEADLDSAEPVDDGIARRLKNYFTDCEIKGIGLKNTATTTLAEVECLGIRYGPKKILLDYANFVHCELLTEDDADGLATVFIENLKAVICQDEVAILGFISYTFKNESVQMPSIVDRGYRGPLWFRSTVLDYNASYFRTSVVNFKKLYLVVDKLQHDG
jgi:hypothetical protein